jgi:ribosome-associated protein
MRHLKKQYAEKEGRELAAACARVALDTKAEDLVVLDVRGLASFTDYFVIMSGRSTRHVQGLAEALREGLWVLLDFGDVVVHVFYHESRSFYDLEGLWHDAAKIDPEELVAAAPNP